VEEPGAAVGATPLSHDGTGYGDSSCLVQCDLVMPRTSGSKLQRVSHLQAEVVHRPLGKHSVHMQADTSTRHARSCMIERFRRSMRHAFA
jgi:hypothetical protein